MLLVMLGHSFVQVPFNSLEAAPWSMWLNNSVYSFHMAVFFAVSGFLYNCGGGKSSASILRSKALRLLVPYLFVTLIVMGAKLVTPGGMTANPLSSGLWANVAFVLLDCGNRWFVYILFVVFALALLLRRPLRRLPVRAAVVAALFVAAALWSCGVNVVTYTVWFFPVFILGMWLREHYAAYVGLMEKRWFVALSAALFLVFNVALVPSCFGFPAMKHVLMPITGVNFCWICCYYLSRCGDTPVMRYVLYVGRYSLQFYLLLFPVAISAYVVGTLLSVTDAALITLLMFLGQIVGITVLVEITRRIPLLKYPLGY